MSVVAEEIARREFQALSETGLVRVRVPVSWEHGFCLPAEDEANEEEEAIFREMTVADNFVIELACTSEVEVDRGIKLPQVDVNEMRRLIVKRHLLEWTLPVPIEREEGWMTSECYARVGSVAAPLLEAFVARFEARTEIDADERERIVRQSVVLFGKNSHGVMGACEAVKLFCMYGGFSEKFGLDRETLMRMPYREYIRLRQVMEKESEAQKREARSRPTAQTKIVAGHGGRVRPSRGIRVPG